MLYAVGKLLIELREDSAVDAIVHGRVRSPEPAPPVYHPTTKALLDPGDARDRSDWVAFVVIVPVGTQRHPRVPTQRSRFVIRCYGRNPTEAWDLYAACSDAIHGVGPRVHAGGLGIYVSHDETGGETDMDPDTRQPLVTFVVELVATTQVVA